ncbi:uncharacterized protein si:dkey-121j17.6 [Lates calcarifer]|uniref:Uncharacterized protein si:dkey-121j17.6 n=1 Tax=Lates calcarifer TaxID=8187 RepID=A0A4W6ET46_LATCA|nr:uncharacterized protein si:dkey-121j17.6 [Lates calcarifer]
MDRRRRLLCAAACVAALLLDDTPEKRKSKRRRVWKKNWSTCSGLPTELTADDSRNDFLKYVKMTPEEFDILLRRVGPLLTRQDTKLRKAIPAKDRLSLTLRFLATGESFKSLSCMYRIGGSTVSKIILETSTVIHQLLQEDFLQMPKSEAEWRTVAEGFLQKWQFPHCVGALDAKRISIQDSGQSGSTFRNNKECSVLLAAAVDADSKFLYVSVGAQGEYSDSFLFEDSDFRRDLDQGLFHLPPAEPLPNSNLTFPYVFVGDGVYPLRSDLMTPFSGEDVDPGQRFFNHQLSRARQPADNAFSILAHRWRIFHTSIHLRPDKVAKVTLAIVCLHNFLCGRRSKAYLPVGPSDGEDRALVEGTWRSEGLGVMRPVQREQETSCSPEGEELQNIMKDYLSRPTHKVREDGSI